MGATDNCPYCNASVVDAYGFSKATMHHYALSGDEADQACEHIQDAVSASGMETGGIGGIDACSHCASIFSRQD